MLPYVYNAPHKTVLVVDDEAPIVGLVRTMLERAGYAVLEASDAQQALRIAADATKTIDLLLTDLLMPDMNGFQLADRVRELRPGVRVLFMTGYLDRVISERTGQTLTRGPCIRKPFKQFTLTQKIAEVLSRSTAPA